MKRLFFIGLGAVLLFCRLPSRAAESGPDIDTLLSKLSLDEKIGQMMQIDLGILVVPHSSPMRLDESKLREALVANHVGALFNNGEDKALSVAHWHAILKACQDMERADTPHQIPVLYGIDSIHGATYVRDSTLFPQNIAMGATRDPDLVRRCAQISAMETRAAGIRWNFAPVLGVGRQPLWSRLPETFGEDTYLTTVLGAAEVRGFQGNNVDTPATVAACMKHYLGYTFPWSGKDRSPALIPDSYLREYFLPPFRAAVEAGVKTVMVNSSDINGVPVHASKYLLTDVLRGELGFQGVVDSDWQDIIKLHTLHHVAATQKDAVLMAVNAGIDMSMVPLNYSFGKLLKELVREGKVPESRIDTSVRRILELKKELGLFANPYPEPAAAKNFGKPEYHLVALKAAEEAMTLLKNEDATLPLSKSAKVLVAGPAANSLSALNGCWSYTWQGRDEKLYPKGEPTIVEAIRQKIGADKVSYAEGVDFDGKAVDVTAAVADAKKADAVVLCLGENSYAETPGDINDLDLPEGQQELAKQLYASGKPVVLVLVEGRTRIIREIVPGAKGILMAYWPGSEGALAIANVLFGDSNPSGKLPVTYQRYPNNLMTYDRKYSAMLDEFNPPAGHKAVEYTPQWGFGYGLSYTTFNYQHLKLSSSVLKSGRRLKVSVDVSNTGKRAGIETVELYTHEFYASIAPPQRRLRGFKRVSLQPGEIRTVNFELTPDNLALVNADSKTVTEPGKFEVMIGGLKSEFRYEQ